MEQYMGYRPSFTTMTILPDDDVNISIDRPVPSMSLAASCVQTRALIVSVELVTECPNTKLMLPTPRAILLLLCPLLASEGGQCKGWLSLVHIAVFTLASKSREVLFAVAKNVDEWTSRLFEV